jgi:membrane-bound ClpP family serine protease
MSTLVDLVFEENPGRKRQELLRRIEEEVRKQAIWGSVFCVMSIATNVYNPLPAYLGYSMIGHIEEHLVKFRQEGCKGVLILLSTYGGEITFPEALISKIRDMGFEKVHIFILDVAFSAGTLLALLSDKIIGFSNSHVGPVDPQIIAATPQGVQRVISAMSIKRLIEEVLPKLADEQKLGKEGLTRLYATQDLYLYENALESIKYIDNIFSNKICKTVNKCNELKKLLLHETTEHSQPIPLQQLANIIPEKVVLIDQDSSLQQLLALIMSYRALLRYLFTFESRPGAIPSTFKLFVIGSKYGEIIGEASLAPPQIPTPRAPPQQAPSSQQASQ